METIMKIINALSALTAALQEFTAQTTEGYLNTFETIYDPEKDEPQETTAKEQTAPEQQTVTFVELRSRLSEISRNGHTAEVKEILSKFGADKLSDVAESDYTALLAEAEVL